MKRIKMKAKLKLWEKIFLSISIILILIISSIYMYRLMHYYKIEHPKQKDNTLATHIIKKGTTTSGDGLYTFDSKNYYYEGTNVDNYLWYAGRMFRIINIDEEGITLITEDSQTSLVWSLDNDFKNSYIYTWLNKNDNNNTGIFLNSINNYENDLIINSWCIGVNNLEQDSCNEQIESYVSLLSISDYLKAGGINSYLNNKTYWWTSNISENGKPLYIFNTGGINDEISSNDTYYSYGVRPVIKIIRSLTYLKGEGTKENPYQIKKENAIDTKSIGEYVKYGDYLWRIQSKNNETLKLILTENNTKIKYTNINNYLNKTFYNTLNKTYLKKCDFYKGVYNKITNYDYQNIYQDKINNYVGIPSIGELFINNYENIWLYNPYGESSLQYKTTTKNLIIADISSNENYVIPIICIKNDITFLNGDGTKENPYILEG